MKLSFRDQLIVAVIGVVLVAVAFVVLLVVPQFARLAQLDTEMRAAETSISEAKGLLARRQEAKAQAADTQSQILHLDNVMPDAPELPALIVEMQQLANDAGLSLDQVAPEKPVPAEGYSKIDIDFSVVGRWEDLLDYLRRLQTLQRGVRVLSMQVHPGSNTVAYPSSVTVSSTTDPTVVSAMDPNAIYASVTIEAYTVDSSKTGSPGGASGGE